MSAQNTKTFFQVTIVRLSSYDDAADYDFNERGELSYHTLNSETAFFNTLEEAEALIHQVAAQVPSEDDNPIHHFEVTELPFGTCFPSFERLSKRSYLSSGEFWESNPLSTLLTDGDLEIFEGRDSKNCHFRKGDIVEVYRGDIHLGVITALPPSKKWVAEYTERAKQNFPYSPKRKGGYPHLDYSDDCYMVVYAYKDKDGSIHPDHSHPDVCDVFKPCKNVTVEIEQELRNCLERSSKGEL